MKKLFVIIAVLALMAGTVYAADLNDGLTRQVYAHSKARAVESDKSEALVIWYNGSGTNPMAVVTSNTSWGVYDSVNGVQALTGSVGTTVQSHVDTINALAGWHAIVGRDVTPNSVTSATLIAGAVLVGSNQANGYIVYNDTSTLLSVSAGVLASDSFNNQLNQYTFSIGQTAGRLYVTTWDGNNLMDSRVFTPAILNSATSTGATPNTVVYSTTGTKGITSARGSNLVVYAHGTSVMGDASDVPTTTQLSIVYDQF